MRKTGISLLIGGRGGKKQSKMKRVAQTENKNKKYGTQKSVKGVEQQGEGEELKKKQVEGGRAGEVVKKGGGRERDRRGGSYVVVYRVAESRYKNLTQGRVLYENLV